jgi:hypothetical protein
MPYNSMNNTGTPMTELQTKVFDAIKSGKTDEEKTVLAIDAVRIWYMIQGYFGRAYEIDAENPNE